LDEEKYKARFLSYFANTILYASNQYFKTQNKIINNEIELKEELITSFSNLDLEFENDVFSVLKNYEKMKIITSKQAKVLMLTALGKSDSVVGAQLGTSSSTVRVMRKQARDKIRKYEEGDKNER
jgi:DNA-binding NarL/FixJ family response regulator